MYNVAIIGAGPAGIFSALEIVKLRPEWKVVLIEKGQKIEKRKYNEQRRLKKDTVFQHFTTSFRLLPFFHKVTIKPWNIDKVHKRLKIFEYDDILTRVSKNTKRDKTSKLM